MSKSARPVDEACIRVFVNDIPAGCWTCTPARLEDLAAGWLLATGRARTVADILDLAIDGETARLSVTGTAAPFDCDPLARQLAVLEDPDPVPPIARFPSLFRELYTSAEIGLESGGLHVAGVADGAKLVLSVEDVARHAAVDKVIGALARQNADFARLGLVLSARISGEIAWKAARAGFAWVASRSVPTTLAVSVAARAQMPLIARAASESARVFGMAGADR